MQFPLFDVSSLAGQRTVAHSVRNIDFRLQVIVIGEKAEILFTYLRRFDFSDFFLKEY